MNAEQEFQALHKLHAHFRRIGGPYRVPAPVALLPEIGALVMEFVPGPTIRQLLHYGSATHPNKLLQNLSCAGKFLRQLHALDAATARETNLYDMAQQVLSSAAAKLDPLALSLPAEVVCALEGVPPIVVSHPQVALHGDFGPGNIILADDGTTVGVDAALDTVGHPEADLVRFLVLTSASIRFAPDMLVPPARAVRRQLERYLMGGYSGSQRVAPLFELMYLHQLVSRWPRARDLAAQTERRSLTPLRLRIVDAQIRLLMTERSRRLIKVLGQ